MPNLLKLGHAVLTQENRRSDLLVIVARGFNVTHFLER